MFIFEKLSEEKRKSLELLRRLSFWLMKNDQVGIERERKRKISKWMKTEIEREERNIIARKPNINSDRYRIERTKREWLKNVQSNKQN